MRPNHIMHKYNKTRHNRQSTRLRGYDYSRNGAYFVTLCTYQRECVLGEIVRGEMRLNEIGQAVLETWQQLPRYFPNIRLDEFVVMPNHVHGIVIIDRSIDNHHVGAQFIAPKNENAPNRENMSDWDSVTTRGVMNHAPTLGNVIRAFKAMAARKIHLSGFSNRMWQRNYHDHIIRNEKSLNEIRRYIIYNPARWDLDRNNPKNIRE